MKASLRLTLQIIAVITLILFIVPLFLPSGFTVTSSLDIKAPQKIIFNEVNTLKNQEKWSPFEQDTTLINRYEGPVSGTGAKRSWTSLHSGSGTQEIIGSEPFHRIKTAINFGAPGRAFETWQFVPAGDLTHVKWSLDIDRLQYPFGKWLGLLMRKSLKQIMAKGLDRLKTVSLEAYKKQKHGPRPSPQKN